MTGDRETLIAEAMLGQDADDFLRSDVGRYLVGRAKHEEREALEALSEVDAADTGRVRELQSMAWRARSVREWLNECVTAGRAAENALEYGESDD